MRPGKLARFAQLESIAVDNRELDQSELDDGEVKPGQSDYNASDRTWRFAIPTTPERSTPVRILSEFIKERSDTEIFAFLQPTQGVTIRFDFRLDGLSRTDAKARTATVLTKTPSRRGHDRQWTISGPVLPNDYVAVWWVSDPDYIAARKAGKSEADLAGWDDVDRSGPEGSALEAPLPEPAAVGAAGVDAQIDVPPIVRAGLLTPVQDIHSPSKNDPKQDLRSYARRAIERVTSLFPWNGP